MSEQWKGGEVAYVPVTIVNPVTYRNGKIAVTVAGESFTSWIGHVTTNELLRSVPPLRPVPVDASAIRVGDNVTIDATVLQANSNKFEPSKVLVKISGYALLQAWIDAKFIASHTPGQRPTTLAEFDALPLEVRERLFAEMVNAKRVE